MKFRILIHLSPPDQLAVKFRMLNNIQDGKNVNIAISMQHSEKFHEFIPIRLSVKSFSVKSNTVTAYHFKSGKIA